MKPTILVLGGGIGGVTAARELRQSFGNEDGINLARILVFERDRESLYSPSLTWMMVGKRTNEQVHHNLDEIAFNGVEIIYGDIQAIDPASKTVTSAGKSYHGDYMIISLGAEKSAQQALDQAGHNFYTSKGASKFYEELKEFKGGNVAITVSSLPHTSPVAPYEAALLVDDYTREIGVREATSITLYTPETAPMPFASEEVSNHVLALMKESNIAYRPQHKLKALDSDHLTFTTPTELEVSAPFDLLAFTPEHRCPEMLKSAGLTDDAGWVEVDLARLKTPYEDVYAIGDIISYGSDSKESVPRAGVFAQTQARVVAHNIARLHSGKEPDMSFEPAGAYILDQGDKGSKVTGNFESHETSHSTAGRLRHWEKVLAEKSWHLKNFQS